MTIESLMKFNDLAEVCGNRFLAVKMIAKQSRRLGKEYSDYCISESKLIDWVLTGKCPYSDEAMFRRKRDRDDPIVKEILEWVDDLEVAEEVREIYSESIRTHRIVESRNANLSPYRQRRATILLRMIWYSE